MTTEAAPSSSSIADHPAQPQISVITAVLNGAATLEACLQSVRAQVGVTVEHIVIDGGSTDQTVDILRRNSGSLACWISEPDSGIADAMNKGAKRACGQWLLFLQSDDTLLSPSVLKQASEHLTRTAADIVGFPIHLGTADRYLVRTPRGGTEWLRLKTGFHHQGTFIRRESFERLRAYDRRFRIAMDYEFFLRAWLDAVPMETRRAPAIALMGRGGISSKLDWPSLSRRLAEEQAIHRLHSRGIFLRAFYLFYWAIYPAYRRLRAWVPMHWPGA